MVGRVFILATTWMAFAGTAIRAESPVRGKYIQPPASAKAKPSPSPSAISAACEQDLTSETCRIPTSDSITSKPEAKAEPDLSALSKKAPETKTTAKPSVTSTKKK